MHAALAFLLAVLVAPSLAWGEAGAIRPVRMIRPEIGRGVALETAADARPLQVDLRASSGPDSFQVIAQTLAFYYIPPLFGDANHDGSPEASGGVSTSDTFTYRILEYDKNNGTFNQSFSGPEMTPYAVGDIDHDGKADVIGQYGGVLRMYESLSPGEYPTSLVWQSGPMPNIIGYSTVGDTDRDGNLEILHSRNSGSSRLLIFESTGDNTFALKLNTLTSGSQESGAKVIADLDQDGLLEIAFCGTNGYLHIFESPANDVWQETFTDTTGMINAYAVAGGFDTDGNGKPELFVAGDSSCGYLTRVYEATSDNTFSRVGSIRVCTSASGASSNCIANTDGVGNPEYAWLVYRQLLVERAVAPGQWVLADVIADPNPNASHTLLTHYDVNKNGRDELYWTFDGNTNFGNTLVLERPATSPTDATLGPVRPFVATVEPTPCRSQAMLRLPDRTTSGPASAVSVFDVGGRLVLRQNIAPGAGGAIGLPVHSLRAGCYVFRVENATGRMIATARTVVVR